MRPSLFFAIKSNLRYVIKYVIYNGANGTIKKQR